MIEITETDALSRVAAYCSTAEHCRAEVTEKLQRWGIPYDAIDLSGRPYLGFESTFTADSVGYFDTQMVKEFFYAISYSAGMNLHIRKIAGENDHHIIEGMFKAFAKALDEATVKDTRIKTILSTKGSL